MKKLLIVLVIILGFSSFASGEPPVKQVEVVNVPLDVNVVSQPAPIEYEYFVFETQNVADFQSVLDEKAAEGYELNFFTGYAVVGVYTTQHYIGIMRKSAE